MPQLPDKLDETLELLDLVPDRGERIQLLIDIADRFEEVPPRIARRPFSADHLVPGLRVARPTSGRSGGRTARSTSTSRSRIRRGSPPRRWR